MPDCSSPSSSSSESQRRSSSPKPQRRVYLHITQEKLLPGKVLQYMKLSERARAPTRCSPFAAGFDLYSAMDITIQPRDKEVISTDLRVAVPLGTYGRVAPRSGLVFHHSIDVGASVIDHDYRGPLRVVLFNHANTPFRVKEGDRIAQLICEPFVPPELTEVDHLDETSPPILVIDQTEQGSRVFDQDRVTRIATDLEAAELLEKTISE